MNKLFLPFCFTYVALNIFFAVWQFLYLRLLHTKSDITLGCHTTALLQVALVKIMQRFMEKNVKVTWTTISKPMDGLIATFIERRLTWLEAIA